jgi:hypothetical protein
VAERTVSRLNPTRPTPPSQTWQTFLANHVRDLVSLDFFTVPTTHLRVLFVLVVLALPRRRVLQFNVPEHPTAAWTTQQIGDASPTTPRRRISSAIATESTGTRSGNESGAWGSVKF